MNPAADGPRPSDARNVFVLGLVLSAVCAAPFLFAALAPPSGRSFAGTFHWIDDFCNYVSYAQQAESGRFVFEDKLAVEPQRGVLVNLEWWLVGRVSALVGRRPFLAYRLVAVLATFALLGAIFQWLRGLGVPASHRLAAAALVSTGGGLGGLLFEFTERSVERCPDLAIGFHPFLAMLAQPHWTASLALLLWALWWAWRARTPRQHLTAIALGTALALVRPYDLVLLVAARGLAILAGTRPSRWPARLAPLLGLLPVAAYLAWVFQRGFGAFSSSAYASIALPPLDLVWALGPPALCLLAGLRLRTAARRAAAMHLAAWIVVALLLVLLRPVTFSLQFAVGVGAPLLLLAARALARWRPAVTVLATVVLSGSALVAHRTVWRAETHWFPPVEQRGAAIALREPCRDGGLVLAPADIGLYTIALTSCRAYISHPAAPGFAERQRETAAFYGRADAAARGAWLDQRCITHLVLPGDGGLNAASWVGPAAGFHQRGLLSGRFGAVSLYARARPASCP